MDGPSLVSTFLLLLFLVNSFSVVGQTTEEIFTTQEIETTQEQSSNAINLSMRPTLSVVESAASVRIFIDITTDFASTSNVETVMCEFSFTDVSTTGSSDYGPVVNLQSQTFTIAADTSVVSFVVPIVNDQIVENDETFLVTMTNCSGNDVSVTTTSGMTSTTVTIQDDDEAVVSIADGTGNGGLISQTSNHIVLTVASSNAFQDDVSLDLDYSGYTDIFSGNPPDSILLPAGSTSQTIAIPIVSGRDEGRDVTVTVTSPSNNPPLTFSQPSETFTTSTTVVTVGINLSLRPTLSVVESASLARIFIDVTSNFTSSGARTVVCGFSFTDVSTTGSSDYGPVVNLQSQIFTITADTSVVSFVIPIVNDQIVENDEKFLVTMTDCSGNDVIVTTTSGMTSTTVTIQDDDEAVISITDGSGNNGLIPQDSNNVILRVTSSNAFQDDVTIDLDYSGYTEIFSGNPPSSVVLPAGSTSQTIVIPIVSERDEGRDVIVTATSPSNNPPVTINQPSLTFTTSTSVVTPATAIRIGFSSPTYIVTEGGSTRIQLSASGPVSTTFRAGIVATGNVNDIIIGTTAIFTTGGSITFIPVTAISDSTREPRENVVLSIDPSSLPNGFVVDPNRATATIVIIDTTPSPFTFQTPVVTPISTVSPTPSTTPRSAYIIAGVIIGLLALLFSILCVACCCIYFAGSRPVRTTRSYDVTPYEEELPQFTIVKRYIDDFYF